MRTANRAFKHIEKLLLGPSYLWVYPKPWLAMRMSNMKAKLIDMWSILSIFSLQNRCLPQQVGRFEDVKTIKFIMNRSHASEKPSIPSSVWPRSSPRQIAYLRVIVNNMPQKAKATRRITFLALEQLVTSLWKCIKINNWRL